MSWLQKLLPPRIKSSPGERRTPVPEGLWVKCPACVATLYRTDLKRIASAATVPPTIARATPKTFYVIPGCYAGDKRPDALGKIFDRMWRADTARSATGIHCGIGLSLARSLADALGMQLVAATHADGSVHFVVSTAST